MLVGRAKPRRDRTGGSGHRRRLGRHRLRACRRGAETRSPGSPTSPAPAGCWSAREPVTPPELYVRASWPCRQTRWCSTGSDDDPTEVAVYRWSAPGCDCLTPRRGCTARWSAGEVTIVSSATWTPTARTPWSTAAAPRGAHVVRHRLGPAAVGCGCCSSGRRSLAAGLVLPRGHRPAPAAGADGPVRRAARAAGAGRQECLAGAAMAGRPGFAVLVVDGRGTPGRDPGWEREVHHDFVGPPCSRTRSTHWPRPRSSSRISTSAGSASAAGRSVAGWPRLPCCVGPTCSRWGRRRARSSTGRCTTLLHGALSGHAAGRRRGLQELLAARRCAVAVAATAGDPRARRRQRRAAHTLRFSQRLTEAGRPHAVLPLTGVTHMTPQEAVAENLLLLQVEFLRGIGPDGLALATAPACAARSLAKSSASDQLAPLPICRRYFMTWERCSSPRAPISRSPAGRGRGTCRRRPRRRRS